MNGEVVVISTLVDDDLVRFPLRVLGDIVFLAAAKRNIQLSTFILHYLCCAHFAVCEGLALILTATSTLFCI